MLACKFPVLSGPLGPIDNKSGRSPYFFPLLIFITFFSRSISNISPALSYCSPTAELFAIQTLSPTLNLNSC